MAKTPTKAERERTRKQLLAAEAALLLLLLSASKKRNAEDAIVAALRSSQTQSKLLARQRFAAELRVPIATEKTRTMRVVVRRDMGDGTFKEFIQTHNVPLTNKRDERAQRRLATRFAAGARRRRDEAKFAPDPKAAAATAAASNEAALRRIATTETLRVFEEERRRTAEEFSRVSGTPVEKEWDATMDRRTCDTCAGLHGRVVPLAQEFPSGDPPLHPNCRCSVEYRPAT